MVVPQLSEQQRALLRRFMGAYRYTYNRIVGVVEDKDFCQRQFETRSPDLSDVRKYVTVTEPNADASRAWLKDVPYNLRELSAREFKAAQKVSWALHPDGQFQMKMKSIRRARQQTVPFGARGVQLSADGVVLFPKATNRSLIRWATKKDADLLNRLTDEDNVHPLQHYTTVGGGGTSSTSLWTVSRSGRRGSVRTTMTRLRAIRRRRRRHDG